jgi:lipid II:glycine glycyltransferase (peptidoglycan interpeptide bridge formation enzyme)
MARRRQARTRYTPNWMALESSLTNALTPALAHEVEEFLDSQDTAHLFQFPQWADPGAKFLLLREGAKIRWTGTFGVYAPLGWKLPWVRAATANRGPVCDDFEFWAAAAEKLSESFGAERIAYIEVSPDWIQASENESPSVFSGPQWESVNTQRASLRVDLTASEETIFANFRKNSRYEVRRSERLGAVVNLASSEADIDEFLRVYQGLAARKGFPPDELERLRRQIRWLMNSGSRGALLLARTDNVVRGGAVIGRAGRRCWYVWGATDAQDLNVGHLVQWRALQWAKNHGCTEYDFGGYTPGATSGPAWFKAGFGGRVVRFVAPHRMVIRPVRYRVFSFLSKSG